MRLRNVVLMTVVLVSILTSPALSQQWVDVKDPKDLKALHSNKTFKYTAEVPIVEHYRADGKGIRIYGEYRQPFTWEVKGDQVCLPDTREVTHCWQYQRSKKNPDEYVRRDPNGWMQVIRVEDGIPEF